MSMKNGNIVNEDAVRLETVNKCELCGSDDAERVLASCGIRQKCTREYLLVKCRKCGLVYTDPRPTKESILSYYLDTDTEKTERKPMLHERFYFNLFRSVPLKQRGSLLDVGCGSGRYIYILREKGWDAKGIDIAYTDYGRKELGLDIYEGNLLKANFPSESFDAVTFWWTLEHMYEPLSMLRETCRILKKNGVLIVGVPNIESLEARIFKRYWFHLFLPKHMYQFSPDSLTMLLNKAGFDKVKIRHDMFSFGILGSVQCFLNSRNINISLNSPLFYLMSLPVDIMLGLIRKSGLITAYAFKK